MSNNKHKERNMQRSTRGIALGAVLMATGACASTPVTTDFSPSAPFSQYRSFALVARPDSASHQLIDDRVGNAVATQLKAKGLTETSRDKADLYVGFGVVDRTHKQVYTTGTGWGWGGGWGWHSWRWGVAWPMDMRRSVETYTDGTVVIHLVDAKTKRVVWQGQAADVLSLPVDNPASATSKIDNAVAKILAKYPPSSVS
jgi:Domain of unknown function (DUF4136)